MHISPHPRWVILAALSLLSLLTSPAAQAAAHPASSAPPFRLISVRPMRVVGFNIAIARAHGYMIITRHGVEMSVPAGHPNAKPLNTVSGNCGDSYVYAGESRLTFKF
jgi:hypothetical protein